MAGRSPNKIPLWRLLDKTPNRLVYPSPNNVKRRQSGSTDGLGDALKIQLTVPRSTAKNLLEADLKEAFAPAS